MTQNPSRDLHLPVACSVSGTGSIQQLIFQEKEFNNNEFRLFPPETSDQHYKNQVALVQDLVQAFAQIPFVTGLIEPNTYRKTFQIGIQSELHCEGGSHGLSMLAGSIARILGADVRDDQIFSVQLRQYQNTIHNIELEPVADIVQKSNAAGAPESGISRFYYQWRANSGIPETQRQEPLLRRTEIAQSGLDEGSRCRLIQLPSQITWQNLVNLSIATDKYFEKLIESGKDCKSIVDLGLTLLENAVFSPAASGEFPFGIGKAIANLRLQYRNFSNFLGSVTAARLFPFCPQHGLRELVKALVSRDPNAAVEDDIKNWVEELPQDYLLNIVDLNEVAAILNAAIACRWIEQNEIAQVERILLDGLIEFAQETIDDRNFKLLETFFETIKECRDLSKKFLKELLQVMEGIFPRLQENDRNDFHRLYGSLARRLLLPEVFYEDEDKLLTIRFSHDCGKPVQDVVCPNCKKSESVVPVINDLNVRYLGPNGLDRCISSPVLLVEASRNLASYSQRKQFRLADDTMARLPRLEGETISQLFGAPTRFEFELRKKPDHAPEKIGVWWVADKMPFPPAIDTQILVRNIERWIHFDEKRANSIRSMIDVGCGTGFIASAAAYLFPRLNDVVLNDLDNLTVGTAFENVAETLVKRNDCPEESGLQPEQVTPYVSDFCQYPKNKCFDLMISNPPYLPKLHLATEGLERAINGTVLLEEVVRRSAKQAKHTLLVFSALAWREFEDAIAPCIEEFKQISVLDRSFVPLRITTIEPIPPDESGMEKESAERIFRRKHEYYQSVLMQKGRDLIDLDAPEWFDKIQTRASESIVQLFGGSPAALAVNDESGLTPEKYEEKLKKLILDSRGFRFWHEVRVVYLESKIN